MKTYKEALTEAKGLPSHIDGKLQNHYKYYGDIRYFSVIMYNEEANPVNVFESLRYRANGATRYYVKSVPTYNEDGNLKKMRDWDKKLMFHQAWSRKDVEINDVQFDIIGIKRTTTCLPAGVLISNIKFSE